MNLERYRSSFTVFVAVSEVSVGKDVAQQLTHAGYLCEQRLTYQSLSEEILKNPPHIIVMAADDKHFFTDDQMRIERLEALNQVLPETQIIFLLQGDRVADCEEYYTHGVYDCLSWPPVHKSELLRAIDRACETNFYMYLNEHLRERAGQTNAPRTFDPALYQVWLKELDLCKSRETAIKVFLREAVRYLQAGEGLFFRYREIHQTLALADSVGVTGPEFEGVGIDLAAQEPGFVPALLTKPHMLYSIQEFVKKGLRRTSAVVLPLIYRRQVLGIFVLPATEGQVFRDDENTDAYLNTCLLALRRQFDMLDLEQRLERLSVFDYESEAYNTEVVQKKLTEEVVRARRLSQPVSILVLQIDGFADMTLAQTAETNRLFLRAFHEITKNTSRVNDIVGRLGLDQFVLCLPHTPLKGASIKAERIRRIVESADFSAILGTKRGVTATIGVSEYPSFCHDAQDLLKSAEMALVEIKRTERNRVGIATVPSRFEPDFVVKDEPTVSPVAG